MLPLALLFAASVAVQPLDEERFRLTIVYRGRDLAAHVQAQEQLATAARRVCRGRGDAVSAGRLNLDEVAEADPKRNRERLALSEDWRCVPRPRR